MSDKSVNKSKSIRFCNVEKTLKQIYEESVNKSDYTYEDFIKLYTSKN